MTLWGRVALAMVLLAVATLGAAGLSAVYFGGGGFEFRALLPAGAVGLVLALFFASFIARQLSQLLAAEAARQEASHRALAESERNAQAIIRTALDAFFQTDMNGIVLEWSPQAEALTGWTRREAIGADVVWTQLGIVHPAAAVRAHQAGLGVVINRCMAIEHRRLMREVESVVY